MDIKQWEDKNLSHFSYAILSDCEKKIVLIDPARDPEQYLAYAKKNEAQIVGVIETHTHADFVSSHEEIHNLTGATIYNSKVTGAAYAHKTFDDGDALQLGKIRLSAINTPGHSPDSITVLLEHDGKQKALFTGDTLFIGDCGRPDLREEGAESSKATGESLARQMYHSLRDKLMPFGNDVIIYPAHGAGTLCGKSLRKAKSSTLGEEKQNNWCLQPMTEGEFVKTLLNDQPFIPAYFPYDVECNRTGAPDFNKSITSLKTGAIINSKEDANRLQKNYWIVDARDEKDFKKEHLPHSINLMEEGKFETWLGSLIQPGEKFYLAAATHGHLKKLLARTAAIGYETQIEEAFVIEYGNEEMKKFNLNAFKKHKDDFTIIDVRNPSEIKEEKIFPHSISIPLAEIRKRINEIPTSKPIVVHCAGGYRSAAASSLLQSKLNGNTVVYDMGEAIKEFS